MSQSTKTQLIADILGLLFIIAVFAGLFYCNAHAVHVDKVVSSWVKEIF